MTSYLCPKCGGADYFMSERTVSRHLLQYGGPTQKYAVCKNCDEIMQVTESAGFLAIQIICIGIAIISVVVFLFAYFNPI